MPSDKLTSIIILSYNQLEYTKLCIESIFRYTIAPFELILVDNGSTDGTVDYLESVFGAKIIKNATNQGFAKGFNQGIKEARGDYVALLNNDVVVTDHWLDNMIECLESEESIGIVGPLSNHAKGSQSIKADYDTLDAMHIFAKEFNRQGSEKWFEADDIDAFCMLVKREVIDKVGLLDEDYKLSSFVDSDYCMRTTMAGYRLVCAGNTFVYHFGGRTYLGNETSLDEIKKYSQKDQEIFDEKWGMQGLGGQGDSGSVDITTELHVALFTKMRLDTDSFEANRGELSRQYHKGLGYYFDGRFTEALSVFRKLQERIPSSVYVKQMLALTLMMIGKFAEAEPILAGILKQQHSDPSLLLSYADCLTARGKFNEADSYYKKALEIQPSCLSARIGLLVIQRIKDQPELLKFINNLEALTNLKSQTAEERKEHFTVTYLTVNHGVGGGPKIIFEHVNRLKERGHNVHVVSNWSQPDWFDLRTKVIKVPFGKNITDFIPPESDVVIATFWTQAQELFKVKKSAYAHFAQGDQYLFEKNHEKRTSGYNPEFQRLADINNSLPVPLFVVSEGMRELIKGFYDRESEIIPCAIDLDLFKPRRRRKRQRPKLLMIGPDDLAFKGLYYINEAYQRIKKERDVEIVWVSPKPRSSLQIKCDTFVQKPSQEELAKIYADCDIFVYASIYDAFPLPPLEAMASGTPLVVTVSEGTKSYIKDGVNCLAVPLRDTESIYAAVNHLLDNDLLRERVIKGGLETAANYNWTRTIDILEEKLWNLALSPTPPLLAVLPEEAIEKGDARTKTEMGADRRNPYYADIIKLVPTDAKRILDVGCMTGIAGRALKDRGVTEIVGIEIAAKVSEEDRQYLDRVITANIEKIDLDYPEKYFDCIVLFDVLEHLYNPWQVMADLRRYLVSDGKIICSISNVGHVSVLAQLLKGSWTYKESGILDITHLRFFTLEGIIALLNSAGFKVENIATKAAYDTDEADFLNRLRASGLVSDEYLKHAVAQSFVLTAVPMRNQLVKTLPADKPEKIANAKKQHHQEMASVERLSISKTEVAHDRIARQRPKLSLAMIVKNEADNLGRCLRSVKDVVDEIIIVDTGSTDNTVEIAEEFGAKVIHYNWKDDFADARNLSLDHATGEWVMYLDADEELVQDDRDLLRQLLDDTDFEGFFFNELNYVGDKEEDGAVAHLAFRLWRNKPEYRFKGALHEQIVATVQSHNPKLGYTSIRLHHYGYLNKATRDKDKIQRNLNILLREVEKYPDDPFVRFNLGGEYLRIRDYEKALDQYKKAFANLSNLDLAYASLLIKNIAICLRELGRYDDALKVLVDAEEAYPDYTDLFFVDGLIHLDKKDFTVAIDKFKKCLQLGPAGKTHISQPGMGGYMAAYSLARAYRALGNEHEALLMYRRALEDNPRDCVTLTDMGLMLVHRENPNELKRFLESLVDMTFEDTIVTLSFIFNQGGQYDISLSYLNRLAKKSANPAKVALLQGECLLNLTRYQEAIAELNKIPGSSQYYPLAALNKTLCYVLLGDYKSASESLDSITGYKDFGLSHDLYLAFVDLLRGNSISLQVKAKQREQAQRIVADFLRKILQLEEFDVFEKAIELLKQIGFSLGESNLLLGKIYYDVGYNEMAVEALIRAYENNCADGEAFFILGRTAFENSFYEEAKTFLAEALNKGIEEISLYISLARTLIKLGEVNYALEILDAGAKKYPESPLIAEIKRSISILV